MNIQVKTNVQYSDMTPTLLNIYGGCVNIDNRMVLLFFFFKEISLDPIFIYIAYILLQLLPMKSNPYLLVLCYKSLFMCPHIAQMNENFMFLLNTQCLLYIRNYTNSVFKNITLKSKSVWHGGNSVCLNFLGLWWELVVESFCINRHINTNMTKKLSLILYMTNVKEKHQITGFLFW